MAARLASMARDGVPLVVEGFLTDEGQLAVAIVGFP
jgi:hypothetical protein